MPEEEGLWTGSWGGAMVGLDCVLWPVDCGLCGRDLGWDRDLDWELWRIRVISIIIANTFIIIGGSGSGREPPQPIRIHRWSQWIGRWIGGWKAIENRCLNPKNIARGGGCRLTEEAATRIPESQSQNGGLDDWRTVGGGYDDILWIAFFFSVFFFSVCCWKKKKRRRKKLPLSTASNIVAFLLL